MAKRHRMPKAGQKLKATVKPVRTKASKRGKPARPIARGPRSRPLPGMEQVRDARLDNLCEGIGETRATMNTAKSEEAGLVQASLQRMVAKGATVYRHAGVELARVPGAEKLRVRLTKETGDADESHLERPAPDFDTDAGGRDLGQDELKGEAEA